ncbi:uncharacterized protein LOC120675124 [Panicum virgatum]|uniref:uncharacterized protein LOC120675124 n=1 Tax=Panicum virgatum TaxID=38727 RepID=UPI0019D66214|nr:uncharacterized protein LOC120675124 [Panicum virgatum]
MPHRVAALLLLLPLTAASEEAAPAAAPPVEAVAVTAAALLDRHTAQLARLEELAESLGRSVRALESALARSVDGLTKYFAVGDSRGCVFVFSAAGDALLDLEAASGESQSPHSSPTSRRAAPTASSSPATPTASLPRTASSSRPRTAASSRLLVRGIDASPVVHLEAHHAGRARYVLACNAGDRIRVFTETSASSQATAASSSPRLELPRSTSAPYFHNPNTHSPASYTRRRHCRRPPPPLPLPPARRHPFLQCATALLLHSDSVLRALLPCAAAAAPLRSRPLPPDPPPAPPRARPPAVPACRVTHSCAAASAACSCVDAPATRSCAAALRCLLLARLAPRGSAAGGLRAAV